MHDRDDAVIPYSEAESLIAAWPELKVMTTATLGHRDILANGEVIRGIVEFIGEPVHSA